ncbi:MAG TPA: site-2 protease family protein, partial [Gemmataceae bacterium]|nr:site-2 protease family protein [Gemmataceae bacterium]
FIPLFLFLGDDAGGQLLQVSGGNLLVDLIQTNIVLVLFNMLPAFPMDGGRVLRALLVLPFGRLMATRIAATIGACFAFLFAFSALFGNYMLMVLALFVFLAGQQELAYVRYQASRNRRNPVPPLLLTPDVLDAEPVPVEPNFSGAVWDQSHRVWVLWQDGRPVRTFWMPGSQG